jgi:hypothetical protein
MGGTRVAVGGRTTGLGEERIVGVGVFTAGTPQAARSKLRLATNPTDSKRNGTRGFNWLTLLFLNFMGFHIDNLVGLVLIRSTARAAVDHLLQCLHVLLHNLFRTQIDK